MLLLFALVMLLLSSLACLPGWPHSATWNYFPSVTCGLLALIGALMVNLGYL